MIIIFIGPPFSGKDSQAKLLSSQFKIPVFSMGHLIRDAYERKDPRGVEGFEQYSMKGLHVPIRLKFDLLKEKIETTNGGFIIDNFPATQEDLDTFKEYLISKNLKIDHIFLISISHEEMIKRLTKRGRGDDQLDIVLKRREIQDKDREPVIEYFKSQGLLREIDGSGSIDEVHERVMRHINNG